MKPPMHPRAVHFHQLPACEGQRHVPPVVWEHVVLMEVALSVGLTSVAVVCHETVEGLGIVADVSVVAEALERALAAAG